jgi:proteic killer suppression protein
MRIEFRDDDLRRLFVEADFHLPRLGPEIVKAYRRKVQLLQDAVDERDLYALKSLHFEQLKGDRSHQRSIRLNKQWRLILELITNPDGKLILIIDIEDYH